MLKIKYKRPVLRPQHQQGQCVLSITRAKKCFGLHARCVKPSETQVVHPDGNQSKYKYSPLLLKFNEEMHTHYAKPILIKLCQKNNKEVVSRSASLTRA